MLEVDNLSLSLALREGEISLLRGISFRFEGGALIGVTGDAGSGKTALLMALGGYLPYWSPACKPTGSISIFGEIVKQGTARNDTAIVIENPYTQNSGFKSNALEELLVPLEMRGIPRDLMPGSARCLANRFGLSQILDSKLESLSGGELQRLHIASAMISRPNLLLLDQVLAELDPGFQQRLFKILRTYAMDRKAIVIVSFNPGEADFDRFDGVVTLPGNQLHEKVCAPGQPPVPQPPPKSAGQTPVLKIRDLHFRYSPHRPWLFEGFGLDIQEGRGWLIMGPNGSGKSTLGKLILGIVKPDRGSIELLRSDFSKASSGATAGVNCAFQNPDLYFCKRTVKEELEFGTDKELAAELAGLTGLSDYLNKNPYDLPRGARKLLSFVIAASCRPAVLFLDEPSQYQDTAGVAGLIRAMRFVLDRKTALLCCTHDRRLIDQFPDFSLVTLGRAVSATQVSRACPAPNGRPAPALSPGLFGDKSDIGDARTWFQNTWLDAIDSWVENDRKWSAHGGDIVELLVKKNPAPFSLGSNSRILDIGCGEGRELARLREWLDENGLPEVPLLGIDVQPALINLARWGSLGRSNIKFEAADGADKRLISSLCNKALGGKATLVTCIYVLHDEPDLFGMLQAVSENIDKNGHFVCVLVHPEWTETLASKRLVKIVQKGSQDGCNAAHSGRLTPNWRWLGLYPALEDCGRTVYLPHAFRTLDDYEKAIVNSGFDILSIEQIGDISTAECNSAPYSAAPSVLITARKL